MKEAAAGKTIPPAPPFPRHFTSINPHFHSSIVLAGCDEVVNCIQSQNTPPRSHHRFTQNYNRGYTSVSPHSLHCNFSPLILSIITDNTSRSQSVVRTQPNKLSPSHFNTRSISSYLKLKKKVRSFFKSLKQNFILASTWMRNCRGFIIKQLNIADIFGEAYPRSICMDKGINGFEFCGLWPCNCFKITDEEYVTLDKQVKQNESLESDN